MRVVYNLKRRRWDIYGSRDFSYLTDNGFKDKDSIIKMYEEQYQDVVEVFRLVNEQWGK